MSMRGIVGKALLMDSERAAKYLFGSEPGRKAATHIGRATKMAEMITNAGGTPGGDFIRNAAIRSRQRSQGIARVGAAVGATGVLGSRSRRGNSYKPPRTAQGSGRNA